VNTPAKIILALDIPSAEEALHWAHRLGGEVDVFKIGMQLFYQAGPDIVRTIKAMGVPIFLDLKLHDIPNTVAKACESLVPLEVDYLTLHLSGGRPMLEAAQKAVSGSALKLLGITALTSMDTATLCEIYPGTEMTPSQWAVHLAGFAQQCGLYGIVCSAQENTAMHQAWGDTLKRINPGIRPAGAAAQDQKRIMTPQAAVEQGANYLVIGRPILEATDPVGQVRQIKDSIAHAAGLSA
jgi:orotidine-5'-phosphate decarboxylase